MLCLVWPPYLSFYPDPYPRLCPTPYLSCYLEPYSSCLPESYLSVLPDASPESLLESYPSMLPWILPERLPELYPDMYLIRLTRHYPTAYSAELPYSDLFPTRLHPTRSYPAILLNFLTRLAILQLALPENFLIGIPSWLRLISADNVSRLLR
jgi:hypothetical protein